ncbi:MAG: phosphoribosylamine--glycine ligase [Spirochaetia bacterium]|nr:phosphoribosylamine--glycine ligase [Spirochaetia bacterium]
MLISPVRVLVLGNGGREHALFLKISQSPLVKEIFIAPGNGGNRESEKIQLDVMDFASVLQVVQNRQIDLLVAGSEAPLAAGIKDYFKEKMPLLMVFGPDKNSAQLEASKIFSQKFMERVGIPTAKSRVAQNLNEAIYIIENHPLPMVIKADGLAAGKGVSIHYEKGEAIERCEEIFTDKIFGNAGNNILFQEFLNGQEASLFAMCNGKEAIYLPTACDYKRVYDGGKGPNTGGMGSFSPGNILTSKHIKIAQEKIVQKVIDEFHYTGILYVGLMIDRDDISVVEFNCRLGDPETQCVMPMMETDLVPYLLWSCGKNEAPLKIKEDGFFKAPAKPGYCLNVVLSAKGYPSSDYVRNLPLQFPEKMPENVHIVHAGTKMENGQIVSSGGRIANIVGFDKEPSIARKKVYDFIDSLKKTNDFSKLHYRLDIGEQV